WQRSPAVRGACPPLCARSDSCAVTPHAAPRGRRHLLVPQRPSRQRRANRPPPRFFRGACRTRTPSPPQIRPQSATNFAAATPRAPVPSPVLVPKHSTSPRNTNPIQAVPVTLAHPPLHAGSFSRRSIGRGGRATEVETR